MRDSLESMSGHDAPLAQRDLDDYDRWPIATAVSNVIAASPTEWSTRIGIYGAWGDGKTSVLNFLELQQRRKGNIVIRYSPWGLSSADEIWADFGKQLIAGLKKNGVKVGIWTRVFVWIKARPRALAGILKGAANAAEGAIPFAIPKSAVDMTSGLLERHFRISKRDVEALIAGLGDRRAVVFIDDLDRSDPAVIPKLLLALRELLDFSRFVFVLAFDKSVVTKALELYNKAWGDAGGVFIEKVIDFPFDLPPPSVAQVKSLALRQFAAVCPFVPESVVESVVSLLPLNPRKLKLFARLISSLKAEVERHDPDELDWPTILLFSLMKLENESLTAEFVRRVCDEQDDFDWPAWASGRERTEAQDRKLEELLAAYTYIPEQGKARIRALITAWQKKRAFAAGERLRYQIYFAVKPHNITWGEFRAFFIAWRANRTGTIISEFIAARASAMDVNIATVSAEFIDSVTGHYGTLLEAAGATKLADRHAALIAEASDCLDLYKAMVNLGTADVASYRLDVPACWLRMQRVCLEWQHFTANPGEPDLRQKEVEVLSDCARAAPDPVRIYEALKPWNIEAAPFDARSDQLKKAFISALRSVVETGAIDSALTFF